MRLIDRIVIHCSATEAGKEVTVKDITEWHKERGFITIGYHFVIYANGKINAGRSIEWGGAHAQGYNDHSIGICYIGGLKDGKSADTRTPQQKQSLRNLVDTLRIIYPGIKKVNGHRDLSVDMNGDGIISPSEWMKDCPCFDVRTEL